MEDLDTLFRQLVLEVAFSLVVKILLETEDYLFELLLFHLLGALLVEGVDDKRAVGGDGHGFGLLLVTTLGQKGEGHLVGVVGKRRGFILM